MANNRDPAFLFYDGDAAKDVSHLNRLERGCYFDLIQAQRKFGGYTVEQARKILGKDFEDCWPALEMILSKSDEGKYYIDWIADSTENRRKYAEKQRKRIQEYWDKKKKQDEYRGISVDIPLENENEEEIINSITPEMKIVPKEEIKLEEVGSEKVSIAANLVWKDKRWKESICTGLSITMEELQKWMAKFNASVCNDVIHNFGPSTYKKMIQGWISSKQAKGVRVETSSTIKKSDAAPLTYLQSNGI